MKFLIHCAIGAAMIVATPSIASAQSREPHQKAQPAPTPKQALPARPSGNEPYGRWDRSWGNRPSAPPKHWTRKGDWYRHVRACQQKYRSYNARTDTYRTGAGKTRRCPL